MKRKPNIWPFGAGQPLGRRTTYRVMRTRASAPRSSVKASLRDSKERERERMARKLDDPALERKLKAHYARGGTLNEFLTANPGISKGQFKRCVAAVAAKGGAYDPNAVCAAMERRKYGSAELQRRAKAGKRAAAKKRKRNPAEAAAEVYEEFHGMPSEKVTEVTERIHSHRNLAELGRLENIVVLLPNGKARSIHGFKGALLCSNENKNQLFIKRGDQEIDLAEFGISSPHEIETLGEVVQIDYFTTKKHLGKDGGTALYFHKAGSTRGVSGREKKVGYGPDLIYRMRDKRMEFSGGTYEIKAEGIDK